MQGSPQSPRVFFPLLLLVMGGDPGWVRQSSDADGSHPQIIAGDPRCWHFTVLPMGESLIAATLEAKEPIPAGEYDTVDNKINTWLLARVSSLQHPCSPALGFWAGWCQNTENLLLPLKKDFSFSWATANFCTPHHFIKEVFTYEGILCQSCFIELSLRNENRSQMTKNIEWPPIFRSTSVLHLIYGTAGSMHTCTVVIHSPRILSVQC